MTIDRPGGKKCSASRKKWKKQQRVLLWRFIVSQHQQRTGSLAVLPVRDHQAV